MTTTYAAFLTRPARLLRGFVFVALVVAPGLAAQGFIAPLTEAQSDSVAALLADMKTDERGPYLRIRWYCDDGTIEPPQGTPCAERGGGHQHAELKADAKRLARLGFHVGTILQATTFDEFFDGAGANDRLRQLVMEDYLVAVDDGWVLRRARYYRGARQAEDEERAGTELLERLLADSRWTARNYWLANQLVATIPHVGVQGDQLVQQIRNLSTSLADIEPAFVPVRVKIHSFPSPADLETVAQWKSRSGLSPQARDRLVALHAALDTYYDRRTQLESLARMERRLQGDTAISDKLRAVRGDLGSQRAEAAIPTLASLSSDIRRHVASSTDGRNNLRLLDLNLALQDQAVRWSGAYIDRGMGGSRRDVLAAIPPFVELAYGAGLLSNRERSSIAAEAGDLGGRDDVRAIDYRAHVAYLGRSLDWSVRTVRSAMTPTLERYETVEPRAGTFPDGVTRGSVLLPLARILGSLAADADSVLGASHVVFGEPVRTGIRGLNPGMAVGPLRFATHADLATLDRASIYVLPETVSELRPVGGVLTLDSGNLLSHVQLLARNLGIPNASISTAILPALQAEIDRPILFAVSPLGRVIVADTARLDATARRLVHAPAATTERVTLDGSRLRLDRAAPVPLGDLRSTDSGVIVGPKAANLGQLSAVFPDRVSAGVALPFGLFLRHVDRPWEGEATPLERLELAYAEAARRRARGADEDEIDTYMFEHLAAMRAGIEGLDWDPSLRATVVGAIGDAFGEDLSGGIFVRSDTNVEDLPQFSGAGLNLTVPNQRSVDDILSSIKRVWTSPFSDRAYLWRKQILDEQSAVYPSVLLLETVPSEHSGVLITSGLQLGTGDDLTIAAAEGIGGAVDGEDAETILVRPDSSVRLLSQAKAPRRRILVKGGGVELVPARRPETLMSAPEIGQLITIVERWKEQAPDRTPGRIWDMEFGVVEGHVWLFQVRPFIRFRSSQLLDRLSVLDEELMRNADVPVQLGEGR